MILYDSLCVCPASSCDSSSWSFVSILSSNNSIEIKFHVCLSQVKWSSCILCDACPVKMVIDVTV